ncbi:hypothetical protein M595_5541 [Lyngbya aestuarii BL J]|uniref:Uncharacterized protein n=1 Tax=Lyngbya aestuarii BL J TaxID=1348334 RepID=U7QBX8_9CYAN|nr:hypothetical protein M595_6251 [Lyngbya aestuarii BL J]ERT04515.1 hypothetical protein M595_5541 [Lyngbya aestuarii BL J]
MPWLNSVQKFSIPQQQFTIKTVGYSSYRSGRFGGNRVEKWFGDRYILN